MSTAALPSYTLNKIRANAITCPECGARQVSAVTSWDVRQGHMVRVTFDCTCGRVIGRVAKGKGKQ